MKKLLFLAVIPVALTLFVATPASGAQTKTECEKTSGNVWVGGVCKTEQQVCNDSGFAWGDGRCRNASNGNCPVGNVWLNGQCRTGCGGQGTFFDWGCDSSSRDGITEIIKAIFYIVSGLVAAICLGAIVFGSIRYSASSNNASAAKEGLDIIRNAVLALVLYGCFFAIIILLTGSDVSTIL